LAVGKGIWESIIKRFKVLMFF